MSLFVPYNIFDSAMRTNENSFEKPLTREDPQVQETPENNTRIKHLAHLLSEEGDRIQEQLREKGYNF